jgi:hypothetical protein
MAFIGEPRSGKSTLIKSLMHYYAKAKHFKFGLVITGSKFNGDFDFIKNEKAVWDGYDEERFKKYFETLKKRAEELHEQNKKMPASFIILDDLLGQIANSDWLRNTLARFRHFGVTVMLAAQYANDAKGCGTLFKSVTDIAYLFPTIMHRGVVGMYDSWGGYYKNPEEFKRVLMKVKQTDHACVLYQKSKKTKEEAYLQFKCTPAPGNFALTF